MNVIIQSLGFKHSAELEALVQERLDKLEPMAHGVIRADVTFYIGSESNPENNVTEIRLEVPGNDHFVKKAAASFEQSVDDAVEALKNILRKQKEKDRSHHRMPADDVPGDLSVIIE